VLCCFCLCGCTVQTTKKMEIPKENYEKAGYAVKSYVKEDGTCVVTYSCLGVQNGIVKYLYLDQIEINPKTDRHEFTNKELESAYGLGYNSDKGEWSIQVKALESYIKNNNMTIDAINAIEVYEKDSEHKKVPQINTGLGAVCELDLTDFLDVINQAYNNSHETKAMKLSAGESVRVRQKDERIEVQLAFIGTDYRYKVCFAELETYILDAKIPGSVNALQTKRQTNGETIQWKEEQEAFEEYIIGLNMLEILNVETYDPGNGIETAMPQKGTDLAEVCSIDLREILISIKSAGEHM